MPVSPHLLGCARAPLARHRLRIVLMALLTVVGLLPIRSAAVEAQEVPLGWQALGGPGGRISHLAADGVHLYAISTAAVHRSDDQTQWRETGTLHRSDALYRSPDGGATWMAATNNAPPGALTALYADPATGTLYAGARIGEGFLPGQPDLWRSSDRGAHWEPASLDRTDLRVVAITGGADETGSEALFVGATDTTAEPSSYVYRSTDGGRSWIASPPWHAGGRTGVLLTELVSHSSHPGRLLALTSGGDLYLSDDAGETWTDPGAWGAPASPGVTSAAHLAFDVDRPAMVLAVRSRAQVAIPGSGIAVRTPAATDPPGTPMPLAAQLVARSTDGGSSWTRLNAIGLPASFAATALAAAPGNVFLLSTETGTYRSTDGGLTWRLLEGSLSSSGVSEFLVLPAASPGSATSSSSSAYAVLAATGYGLFISRDAGALWQPLGTGLPFNSKIAGLLTDSRQPERILAISDNAIPELGWSWEPGGKEPAVPPPVLRSLDRGRSAAGWAPVAGGLPAVAPTAWGLDPSDPNTLFLAAEGYFFRSTDAGLSWTTARLPAGERRTLALASSDPNVLYLGGEPLLRSSDRGATWQEAPVLLPGQERQARSVTGLGVDPADAKHLWAGLDGNGVAESNDSGKTWRMAGLAGQKVSWLAAAPGSTAAGGKLRIYAGVAGDGIYRWEESVGAAQQGETGWHAANSGLPKGSTLSAFLSDPRTPGAIWAARDGGGVYRSTDYGVSWANVAAGMGDNLVQALAIDHTVPGGVLAGTATAGVWALRPNAQPSPAPRGVDARVEIVWPHDWAPVTQAKLANLGLRLFLNNSLLPPPCNWTPKVTVWRSMDTAPAEPLGVATQRNVDGRPFPFWELNDVDVSRANDPQHTLYFMARADSTDTRTSIWAHGADPRTFYPQPEVPSGIASGAVTSVDARIQIVWPHEGSGISRPVTEATHANVSVTFFTHGTRLSVPVNWQPAKVQLFGAWNGEIGQPLAQQAVVFARRAGAISYPTWEFNNVPVSRAAVPGNTLYLWVAVEGVETYPTIWAHGADARTFFPAKDEPAQGCVP